MKEVTWLFILLSVDLLGRVVDENFEDNDLHDWCCNNNSSWCISSDNVISGNYSLKHCFDNDVSGMDWISYFHDPLDLTASPAYWSFAIRYAFNPSSNNNWCVYLTSDELPEATGNINNGIVLGVNIQGNSDEIQLGYYTNGVLNDILNTGLNWEDSIGKNKTVYFSIQSNNDRYSAQLDIPGQGLYDLGNFTISGPERINTFTLLSNYTSSYDQGVWFDNLYIKGTFNEDSLAPEVVSAQVLSPTMVELEFNEPVQLHNNIEFEIVNMGIITLSEQINRTVILELPHELVPSTSYMLKLPGLKDVYGNVITAGNKEFWFYYPGAYDIVISEIMADPTPEVLLPNAEYIEITNISGEDVHLKNWLLAVNGKKVMIPGLYLHGSEVIVLSDADNRDLFHSSVSVVPVEGFPVLSNTGAELLLCDAWGRLIHSVNYEASWHSDTEKRDGGWSLEMIDLNDPCIAVNNWSSSVAAEGGTPGAVNSVNRNWIGSQPELWRAAISDSGSVFLYFSEPLDSFSAGNTDYYYVSPDMGRPYAVNCSWPVVNIVELLFNKKFDTGKQYTVELTADIQDCSGATIQWDHAVPLQVAEKPLEGDIVINEIVYEPADSCIEFIELYNTSSKVIDLINTRMSLDESDTGDVIAQEHWPVYPEEYVIVASSDYGIERPGPFVLSKKVVLMSEFPTLVNSGSAIFLFSEEGRTIDRVAYQPTYHHKQLKNTRGVSLERVSSQQSGMEPANWQSASVDAGFMTPAMPNSQSGNFNELFKLSLSAQHITPNGDGVDDFLEIVYELDTPGYIGDLFIFNAQGIRQATLAQGFVLGTKGKFIFNGYNEQGQIPELGYYIVFFRAYHANGKQYARKVSFLIAVE